MNGPSGQVPVRVNRSARQAKAEGLLTSGMSGPPSIGSLRSVDLSVSLANKLRRHLGADGGILWRLTWKKDSITPAGAARVPAASVQAPQLRDRLWWMASTNRERCEGERLRIQSGESREAVHETGRYGEIDIMGGAHIARLSDGWTIATGAQRRNASGATEPTGQIVDWSDAVWIPCMDGKHRPIEPAVVGLDHGLSADLGYQCHEGVGVYAPLIDTGQARTMRLKGFGKCDRATDRRAVPDGSLRRDRISLC